MNHVHNKSSAGEKVDRDKAHASSVGLFCAHKPLIGLKRFTPSKNLRRFFLFTLEKSSPYDKNCLFAL